MKKLSSIPCLIVTLCKSPNYGAYLQAFALKEVLTSYGYKVSFLDVYDRENNKKRYKFLFRGWRRNPASILFNFRKFFAFRYAEKKLVIVSRSDISNFKVAFIGSDEIWSVTNGTFNCAPEFFGLNLKNMWKFSYAPSVGNSGVENMVFFPEYMNGIRAIDLLSVRDTESLEVAKYAISHNDVSLVLDPTFLHDFSKQEEMINVGKPYLLVYTYGFDEVVVKEVRDYALSNNLAIISAGFYHSWVDKNLPCTPFEFLSLVKDAECVITDTFHGSIFSIKYRKNFISYSHHKKKVKHLLESLGLSSCLVSAGYLKEGNEIKTNYSNFELTLQPLLYESKKYLERCNALVNC
ncbi:MAG: polysaccharide pyruvyl transferase family protein [Candidatus Competibacteraceae bacterium]|nr:polysaccharide pyruvyl transferase family protein [Candidatus Competibacteraceae bacterium]